MIQYNKHRGINRENRPLLFQALRKYGSLVLVITLVLAMTGMPVRPAEAAGNTHHLAFASDYRAKEGSIENAFKGMPADTEYVSLIGDMGAEKGSEAPAYNSSGILKSVNGAFPELKAENVSVVWADHDYSVNDDAKIVKCAGGYTSGQIYEGKNSDGSTAYYVYGIGYFDMQNGGKTSHDAAAAFKKWVDNIKDKTIPVIVLCHAPVQAKRGDNNGAMYWNEALNYAATGTEGITSTTKTGTIGRNVLFLNGHNFTCDKTEYYYAAGGKMNVQVDGSSEPLEYSKDKLVQSGVNPVEQSGDDEEMETKATATGVDSNIYYTSLTAGYLNTTGNATLLTIKDGTITLNKYNGGEQVSVGSIGDTGKAADKEVVIKRMTERTAIEHSAVSVTKTDTGGKTISGAVFTLYDKAGKELSTYNGGVFTISTADGKLKEYLPAAGESVTLTLKETKAPSGYKLSDTKYNVVITSTVSTVLNNDEYITKTTYSVTINGKHSLSIANSPTGSSSGSNSSKNINNVPKTGDPLHPGVYGAVALLAVLALAVPAVMRYAGRKRRF